MFAAHSLGPIPPPIAGRVVMVGPCAAGKSTLAQGLAALGYLVHRCGQEHSHVPDMWQRLSRPDKLIYLDVSIEQVKRRRQVSYGDDFLQEQKRRLRHARAHCDLYINTDHLTIELVLATSRDFLERVGLKPLSGA